MARKKKRKQKSKSKLVSLAIGLFSLINFCFALIAFESQVRGYIAPQKLLTQLNLIQSRTLDAKNSLEKKYSHNKSFEPNNNKSVFHTTKAPSLSTHKKNTARINTTTPTTSKPLISPQSKPARKTPSNKPKPTTYNANKSYMAIIIDDIGYQQNEGFRAISVSNNITAAILPFTPYAQQIAKQAHQLGVEVMLHAPMEPDHPGHWGEGLDSKMNKKQIKRKLSAMINNIPNAKGINNHMGSGLTQDAKAMHWVMSILRKKNLYFIDSLTTPNSAATQAAIKNKVATSRRDVFLDNNKDYTSIDRQFNQAINISKKHGFCIAIGHPYKETLYYLEKNLHRLDALDIELIPASQFLLLKTAKLHSPPLETASYIKN